MRSILRSRVVASALPQRVQRPLAPRSLTTKHNTQDASSGGAGTGNVHDQMLPSSGDKDLYKYTQYPHTVSIIGCV